MTNWHTIVTVRTLEEMAAAEGLVLKPARDSWGNSTSTTMVSLCTPEDGNSLPIFSRDTELYAGTVTDCITWLQGWQKQRTYLTILFEHKQGTIERREQRLVEKRFQADVLRRIKEEKSEDTDNK